MKTISAQKARKAITKEMQFVKECRENIYRETKRGQSSCKTTVCSELDQNHWSGTWSRQWESFWRLHFSPSVELESALAHLRTLGYHAKVVTSTYRGELDIAEVQIQW